MCHRIKICTEDMIPDAIEEAFPGTREAGKPATPEDEDDGLDWEEETYEMKRAA